MFMLIRVESPSGSMSFKAFSTTDDLQDFLRTDVMPGFTIGTASANFMLISWAARVTADSSWSDLNKPTLIEFFYGDGDEIYRCYCSDCVCPYDCDHEVKYYYMEVCEPVTALPEPKGTVAAGSGRKRAAADK